MKDVVNARYTALEDMFDGEVGRGAIERSTPFNEWASGKVLLTVVNCPELRFVQRDTDRLIRDISVVLVERESRLKPALTILDEEVGPVIVLLLPR